MQNNILMLNMYYARSGQTLSLPVFPVRTYQYLTVLIEKESKELAADYGLKLQELLMRQNLTICFLRILRNCSNKGLNTSYQTFPKSGTMRNGTVIKLATLAIHTGGKDSMLLPTPIATDGRVGYCNHQALMNYLKNGHQQRLIYLCQLAGLTDSEILELYREMMSFPVSLAKLKRSEMQLCLW